MSEEEKKAIEYLKQNDIVEIQYDNYGLESIHRIGIDEKYIILNLIEKQQKEIETYKLLNANIEKDNKRQSIAIIEYQDLLENSISKDKIREKIKDLEDNMILFTNDKEKFNRYKYARDILEKLLEEK